MKHPDRETCYGYLRECSTPAHIIGHCKSVAAVAYRLGKALNEAGGTKAAPYKEITYYKYPFNNSRYYYMQNHPKSQDDLPYRELDLDLALAAGLLHDILRLEEDHWEAGARFCESKGLPEEESIVRVHMNYQYSNDEFHLTEADLVCLGDRLSLEDRYVGLDKRMDYIIAKAERNGHADARPRILQNKEMNRQLLDKIEARIGCTIDELMADLDYDNTEKR